MRKRLLISAIALAAVAAAGQTVPHGSLGFGVQIDTNLFLLNPSEIVTTPDGTLAGYATVQDLHAAANAATNHSAANLNIAVGHADSLTNGLARAADLAGKQDRLPYPTNAIPAEAIVGGTVDAYTKAETDEMLQEVRSLANEAYDEGINAHNSAVLARNMANAAQATADAKLDKAVIVELPATATIGDVVDKINEIAAAFNPQEEDDE